MKNITKSMIGSFKSRFPRLFYALTKSRVLVQVAIEMDRPRYLWCMLVNKPYFGLVMLASQTWEQRKPFMRSIIASEAAGRKNGFRMLEVGSWSGDSAVLWATEIKKTIPDAVAKGSIVVCVDPWYSYVLGDQNRSINVATLIMEKALRRQKILKLFLHNVRASVHQDIIKPFVGASEQVMPLFKDEYFDLAFVDGAHCYSSVIRDFANATRVLRDGGILCGDDLELQLHEVDHDFAEQNKERDMMIDPRTGRDKPSRDNLGCHRVFQNDNRCL